MKNKNESQNLSPGSNTLLSKDSLAALEELGNILKVIYMRMKKEGYRMVDGRIIKIAKSGHETNREGDYEEDSERNIPE